jgi:2-polyprenyl-3-methyl-5-hydroxy-6-metoxy-1,4-benzoquinol methylase
MNLFNQCTDRDWEKWGSKDPYFGVLTLDKYTKENLTEKNKNEFFVSGKDYIDDILDKIRKHIAPVFTINKALDFGCGVGRLVIPLADVANEVTGVDISQSMLNEARKNCDERLINNVHFIKSNDDLSLLKDKYDFIHSVIVFQHIPITRGEQIFANLMKHLEDDGVCVVHFTYADACSTGKAISFVKQCARRIPLIYKFNNLLNGKKFSALTMQMNSYNLNNLYLAIQKANVAECYSEFTNNGSKLGIIVYFKKPKA